MWRAFRTSGYPMTSSWIDEDGPGQTPSMSDLWGRILDEVRSAVCVVLYVERGDLPLKGAYVECGMALALGKRVRIVAPDIVDGANGPRDLLGSWIHHPLVTFHDSVEEALARATESSS